jgi:hypothetical protein
LRAALLAPLPRPGRPAEAAATACRASAALSSPVTPPARYAAIAVRQTTPNPRVVYEEERLGDATERAEVQSAHDAVRFGVVIGLTVPWRELQ